MQPPVGPPAAAASGDRTTLYGVLGIVLGLICCPIAGIVLGVLSIQQAKRYSTSPTLGYVAIAASIVGIVWSAFSYNYFRK